MDARGVHVSYGENLTLLGTVVGMFGEHVELARLVGIGHIRWATCVEVVGHGFLFKLIILFYM